MVFRHLKIVNSLSLSNVVVFYDKFRTLMAFLFICLLCVMIRLPLQLSSIESMMPLYSAVASARLISSLSMESQHWGLVPQGLLFILSLMVIKQLLTEN